MEEGHQLHVSATVLMQALCSEACSSNDLAAKNNPGPRRRVPPVGIGALERPGDESACTRSCASASCVVTDHAAIPEVLFLPARFSREGASLPAGTIPPHACVSGSGSPGSSFPSAFVPRWDNKHKAVTGARSRWRDGTYWGESHRYPEYCT